MREPTYRQAFSHGWEIARKHKLLWIFGFFATFLGQMGLLDFIVKSFLAVGRQGLGYTEFLNFPAVMSTFFESLGQLRFGLSGWAWMVWLGAFFIGLKILLIFVSVVSQGALVAGVGQTLNILKRKDINTGKAWHEGVGHFWRIFCLNVIKRVAVMCMALVVGFSAFNMAATPSSLNKAVFIVLIILAALVGMILSFLIVYAVAYVVLEQHRFGQSLKSAWQLFIKHALVSLEVGILLIGLNVAAGFVALIGGLLFMGHMAIMWALTMVTGISLIWSTGFVIGVVALVLFVVLIGTLLTVFTTSVWTYLFAKMHKEGIGSRIVHLFSFLK